MASISFASTVDLSQVSAGMYLSATGAATTKLVSGKTIGTITGISSSTVSLTMISVNSSGITFMPGDQNVTWNITGTSKDDYIKLAGPGTVNGGSGADTLIAVGKGDIYLSGGAGADVLSVTSAAIGNVSLEGGAGADKFYLSTKLTSDTKVTLVDYNAAQGDKLYGVTVSTSQLSDPSEMSKLISSDGVLTIPGTSTKAQLTATSGGYYVADVNNVGKVYAAGENGTTVNGSGETKSLYIVGSNNEASDVLRGGSEKDTVYAGATDSILGGRGNDSIVIAEGTESVSVGFSDVANAGTDTVTGATLGFNDGATTMYMANGTLGVNFKGASFAGGNLTLKGKDGELVISGKGLTDTAKVILQDRTGVYNTDFFTGTYEVSTKDARVYYAAAAGATLNFENVSDDLVVDLTGSGFNGDGSVYYNVNHVKGGTSSDATVVMVGSSTSKNTLEAAGAQTSLWGGSGSQDDSLIGGSGKDFFALGTKGGNDKVSSFTAGSESYSDVVYLLGSKLAGVKKNSTGNVTFSLADGSNLVLQTNNSLTDDAKIGFSTSGEQVDTYGKVSSGAANFTYEGDVGAYVSGKAGGAVNVSATDATTVWLDGAEGVGYTNINKVDGSGSTANLVLGGATGKDTLIGGSGNNTLWGGAGADTLVGGSGYNEFFVGVNEGIDLITGANSSDKVMLYNVASTDVKSTTIKNGNLVVEFTKGGGFTVNDYANGPATYEFTDTSFSREDLTSSNS